ncbi:hypothetical protein RchiOBHm_Chr2g0154121 [Rosa chinensis]|uniref:Uncharacterized protein n=1 Tax=Rosa chinensis TaxID=74649 RepID=A0A2P6S0W6_ROSCH|nr:hypothetical protein RchiOBHm_Chr2g0154121 [Rosa chinensis]
MNFILYKFKVYISSLKSLNCNCNKIISCRKFKVVIQVQTLLWFDVDDLKKRSNSLLDPPNFLVECKTSHFFFPTIIRTLASIFQLTPLFLSLFYLQCKKYVKYTQGIFSSGLHLFMLLFLCLSAHIELSVYGVLL